MENLNEKKEFSKRSAGFQPQVFRPTPVRFYNKHFSRTVQLGRYFTRFHRQSLNYNITCRAGAIFHERLFKVRRFGIKRARLGEEGREGAQERRGLEKGKKTTCEGTEHLLISCSCFAFIFLKCLYR